jgi:hypothetical protein
MHRRQPKIIIAPTLARMSRIYALSRKGGSASPRFAGYLGQVEHNWGLASYNPMAGDAAPAAVDALLALDAERVALIAAERAVEECEWTETITLAVVVATPGMWTDRLATEVRHRSVGDRRANHGEIRLWMTDAPDVATIERESIAEAVRTIWTALHGPTLTLQAVLAREGMAYALAQLLKDDGDSARVGHARVADAIEILGDTRTLGDIVAVLYGDAAAVALGYTPLGIEAGAGYEYGIARACEQIKKLGVPAAIRSMPAAAV